MPDKFIEKKITPKATDYSEWYLDVIEAAELAEHSPVKGCMIIKPNGYALWENSQKILDAWFKETGVENAYFPIFIPERLLAKEKEHVEGFAPEVAVVTHAGGKKLEEPLVIRPTSETIMYEVFSHWIRSYRDLPLLINQWVNVVRWEMHTRLFLRTTEFLWQEGHTAHETFEEADKRAQMMLDLYKKFAEDYMAIPVIVGTKTESEKFKGALYTYSVEAMMQDGKALQFATSHNLGQNFSKPFDIKFLDRNNEEKYAWQTSWGLSTRIIGAMIMVHGDDKGLVLPPKIANIQVVIVPIITAEKDRKSVHKKGAEIYEKLKKETDLKIKFDERDKRPGEKFYEWEKRGVPVRIEIGIKDIVKEKVVLVRRDTGDKASIHWDELPRALNQMMEDIQKNLFNRALNYQIAKTKKADNWDEFTKAIKGGNFVMAHFSGDEKDEAEIKEKTGATVRCIPFDHTQDFQPFDAKEEKGKCVYSGKPSKRRVLFAKAY